METTVRSTCCYCGVGCGVLVKSKDGVITEVQGDPDHPANRGRLCNKGLSLAHTVSSTAGRQLNPEMRLTRDMARQAVDWETALDTVAHRFSDTVRRHGPDSVALYVSGQLLTEDYYVFNKLAKGLIGTNNIDTNSRLCMSSAVTAYKRAFGADGPPTCYDDLELAKTVVFAGSNAAYAHPVLFRRLEAARANDPDIKWIVIDPRRTDTAALADLHLAIQPGTDVALFNAMLHHMIWEGWVDPAYLAQHTTGYEALKQLVRDYTPRLAAELCGIPESQIMLAAQWFARSPATLSLYCMGLNQSSHGTDKNLALINLHLATAQIGRPGAGPFSLTGQPNAMGGREVGGMATMLAAHRDLSNPADRAEVERFWRVERVSDTPGLTAIDMFEALANGRVKAIWIVCTNPAHSMPDNLKVREALSKAELVVVQDAFANVDTLAYADIVLPAASWGERSGTVTNSERRISRVRPSVDPPGMARPDWWIAVQVARRMEALLCPNRPDTLFPFEEPASIFDEHRALTAGRDLDISTLDYATLEQHGPQQWPFRQGQGTARRYLDGRFETPDARARMIAVQYEPVAEPTSARYPFHLITGRLRDQWHGMSRSARAPNAFSHVSTPALTMHPHDAQRRNLQDGELVVIGSRRASTVLPLQLSEDVPSGTVFAAMHWNAQFLNHGGINEHLDDSTDAHSRQPELKHASIRVEAAQLPWRVFIARRTDVQRMHGQLQPLLKGCAYASMVFDQGIVIIRAADTQCKDTWLEQLLALLDMHSGPDTVTFKDPRRQLDKRASWQGQQLTGVALAGDVSHADALLTMIRAETPWLGPRVAVFSLKQAPTRSDPVVCQCKLVRQSGIADMAGAGQSLSDIQAALGCGTVCGSCVPEIRRIIAVAQTSAA